MIPEVHDHVWAFDCEWAPDPEAGRLLLNLPREAADALVIDAMWKSGGASEDDPYPFLKMVQCRVLSIAAVQRRVRNGKTELNMLWLPRDPEQSEQCAERNMLNAFLTAIGRHRPQLVGFNSRAADLKIISQRAVTLGLAAPGFCERPPKPWDDKPDYFARENAYHVDLMERLSSWGTRGNVSLNEMCRLSGIPGKLDVEGDQVAHMWMEGRLSDIVQYNCFDALSTYLLWLRCAHFAGHFTHAQYEEEQELTRQMVMDLAEKPETAFIERYFDEWNRLQQTVAAWTSDS